MKKSAIFTNHPNAVDYVYGKGRKERVAQITDLYPRIITSDNFEEHVQYLQDVEVIFSTWGMFALTDEHLNQLPSLEALFYAAGTVQGFARPLLKRNITVMSAGAANAVPVAEFTFAQILLATKGYFRNAQDCRSFEIRHKGEEFRGRGNFGETISIIGAGMVGRKLIELLKNVHLRVVVYDPYLNEEKAEELGVKKVSLEEAFQKGLVVSNHTPNLPSTTRILNGNLFKLMRDGATFINTGRGATVAEDELISVFRERPSLTALLDVA